MKENQDQPSKSAKKRESAALQKLGEALTKISVAERESLDLPPDLLEALALHDKITDREGGRRQRQYIGKLMRGEDTTKITAYLASRQNMTAAQTRMFHIIEKTRDDLLAADDSELGAIINALMGEYRLDPEKLRPAIAEARKSKGSSQQKAASRKLFRTLAEMLDPQAESE